MITKLAGTIENYVGNIADLTQGLGMAKDTSLDFSKGAVETGLALAQWGNVEPDVAINDLTSALSGSHEVMSKYGVKLNETVLNEYTRSAGLGDSFNKLNEVQKAQVRYDAILGSSQNAIDNWAEGNRTAGFYTTALKEQMGNISETIGGQLKDSFNGVIQQMLEWVTNIARMLADNPALVNTIINIAGALAGLGPVLGVVAVGFKVASVVMAIASGGLMAFLSPVVLVVAGVTALYFAFVTNFGGIRDTTIEIMGYIQNIITSVWAYIQSNWSETLESIKYLVETIFVAIQAYINAVMTAVKGIIKAVMQIIQGDWSGAWETIKETVRTVLNIMKNIVVNLFDAIVDVVISIGVNLANAMYNAWNKAKEKATEVWNNLCDWFKGAVEDPVGTIKNIGSAMYNAGKDMINSVWDGCKSIWNSISQWFTDKVNWIKDKLTFWNSSKSQMSGGGGGGSTASSKMTGYAMSRLAYAMPAGATSSTTNITFSGNYNFSNRGDIDYFMQQAGQQMRRNR